MSLDIKYLPLTFITSDQEILRQLRNTVLFSFLDKKYKETTLENYIESTQYGYTASAKESGSHLLLRITDITNGKVNWAQVPFCDCDSEQKYILNDDDILVARTGGTTGKSFIVKDVPKNAVFASYLIRLRVKDNVELAFIEAFLNSYAFWPQVIEMKAGTAMPNVNAEKLKTLRLPLCDQKTQRDVLRAFENREQAESYSDLFQAMETVEGLFADSKKLSFELTHQLDLLKQLRQAFLREAMQGKLVPQDKNDEPASELLKKIKDEKKQLIKEKKIKKEKELPPIKPEEIPFEIPENWVWCRLGEVCLKIHYGFNASAKPEKREVRLLRITDIQDNKVDWETVPGCDYTKSDLDNYLLSENDIVIARTGGTIGKTYLVKGLTVKSLFASYLIRSIPSSSISAEFLKYFLESPLYWKQLLDAAWGAGQPNVNGSSLSNLMLPLPPLSEQNRIVAKLEQLMRYCDELEQSIKQSQTQNEQLLQQVLREALQPKKQYEIKDELSLAAED